jgi:hypothetical protein
MNKKNPQTKNHLNIIKKSFIYVCVGILSIFMLDPLYIFAKEKNIKETKKYDEILRVQNAEIDIQETNQDKDIINQIIPQEIENIQTSNREIIEETQQPQTTEIQTSIESQNLDLQEFKQNKHPKIEKN